MDYQVAAGAKEVEGESKLVKIYDREKGRVFIHPSSVNFGVSGFESGWLVYTDMVETGEKLVGYLLLLKNKSENILTCFVQDGSIGCIGWLQERFMFGNPRWYLFMGCLFLVESSLSSMSLTR